MRNYFLFLLFAVCSAEAFETTKPCRLAKAEFGYVCICDKDYCDSLDVPEPKYGNKYVLVTSSKDGDRFSYQKGKFSRRKCSKQKCRSHNSSNIYVKINRKIKYQKMCGFGGAITGAVSHVLDLLPPSLQRCVYKSYYSKGFGMGYDLMRIPIAGCDFDLEPWAYNEYPENDISLSNFTQLDPRDLRKTEQLKDLMNVSKNKNIKIYSGERRNNFIQ